MAEVADRERAVHTLNVIRYTPTALVLGLFATCVIGPAVVVTALIYPFTVEARPMPSLVVALAVVAIGLCGVLVTLLTFPLLAILDEYRTSKARALAVLSEATPGR